MSSNSTEEKMDEINHPRWHATWNNGVTPGQGFDATCSSPMLQKLVKEEKIATSGKFLVPGCGRGYDLALLASNGKRHVTGAEIADKAVEAANDYLSKQNLPKDSYVVTKSNFFHLSENKEDQFDFVYDYTFLCALNPSVRKDWAKKMAGVLKPGGELLTLIFPIGKRTSDGPPFAVSLELLTELLSPYFENTQLELLPKELCHPDRDGSSGRLGNVTSGIGRWTRK